MGPEASAILVLLSCSPGWACRPLEIAPQVYSADECKAALADRLAKSPVGEVIGRCREVDATVTDSPPPGYSALTVTRGTKTTNYLVPHKVD
ncbi:hypothetical protein CK219_30305 [Mesorhizobium sp. WSM4313]|nr:hypothetical protein CK219_30305 [Mesorhizobium sp. WSM4313]